MANTPHVLAQRLALREIGQPSSYEATHGGYARHPKLSAFGVATLSFRAARDLVVGMPLLES